MTSRQKKFCEEYAISGNGNAAYQIAYGRKNDCRAEASNLLTKSNINEYIKELNEKILSKKIMSIQEMQERLTEYIKQDDIEIKDKLKSIEMLGKSKGMFVDRHEVQEEININIGIDEDE